MLSNEDDLKRMPSPPKTLPDASSAKFMEHLGLDMRQEDHAQLYREMKADAVQAHRRICSERGNLLPYLQNDPSIRSPFTVTQITEQALHDEALRMHAEAKGQVKEIYDSAAAMEEGSRGSWAARWMLWHVFLRGGEDESPGDVGVGSKDWVLDPLALKDEAERGDGSWRRSVHDGKLSLPSGENRSFWDPVRHA